MAYMERGLLRKKIREIVEKEREIALNELKKRLESDEEIKEKLDRGSKFKIPASTFQHNIGSIDEISVVSEKDKKTGKNVRKCIWIGIKNKADPRGVEMILKNLKSDVPQVREEAAKDLSELSREKKIAEPEQLKSLIKIIKNPRDKAIRHELMFGLWQTVIHITRDEDEELIKIIKENAKYFRKIALNKSEIPKTRDRAGYILRSINDEELLNIAFKILEDAQETYNNLLFPRDRIRSLAITRNIEIKNKLYKILAKHPDDLVGKRALELIEAIRAGGQSRFNVNGQGSLQGSFLSPHNYF